MNLVAWLIVVLVALVLAQLIALTREPECGHCGAKDWWHVSPRFWRCDTCGRLRDDWEENP